MTSATDAADEVRRLTARVRALEGQLSRRTQAAGSDLDSLLNNVNVSVFRSTGTHHGRLLYANPAMASMFAFDSVEAFMQSRSEDLFAVPDDRRILIDTLARDGAVRDYEIQLRRNDGSLFWGACTARIQAAMDGNEGWIDGVVEDITERRRDNEALVQAVEQLSRLEQIINRSPAVVCLRRIAEGWPIEYVSDNMQMFGFSAESVLSGEVSCGAIIHASDMLRLEREVGEHLRCGRDEWKTQYRLFTRTGELRWVEDHNLVIKDADGNPTHVQGIVLDVTKRRETEAALAVSEARWRTLATAAADYILTCGLDGKIDFANREIDGCPAEELCGQSVWELIAAAEREAIEQTFLQVHTEGTPRNMEIGRFGGEKPDSVYALHIAPAQQAAIGGSVMLFARDITELRRTALELQQSEERFRQLAENIREVFWVSGTAFDDILYVSPAFEDVWGLPLSALRERPSAWMESVHPEDQEAFREIGVQLRSGEPTIAEYRIVWPDGTIRWVRDSGFPVRDDHGTITGFVGSAEDITVRKEAEEHLLAQQQQLRSLAAELSSSESRERRRIAARLHDEIGQQLASCHLHLGRAIRHKGEPRRAQVESARQILEGVMAETRRMTYELSSPVLDMLGFRAAVSQLADELASGHSLHVDCVFEGDEGQLEEGLRDLLYRTVRELLFNAVKHARSDRASVRIAFLPKAIELQVADQGVGFDTANVGEAFSASGGFGLFSIRQRMQHVGASISIESTPGQGTRIAIQCPRDADSRGAEERP